MSSGNDTVGKTLLVAFLLCVVCAIVVSFSAVKLKPVQKINKALDMQVNILRAAGLVKPEDKPSAADIKAMFASIDARLIDVRSGQFVEGDAIAYDQRKAAKDPSASLVIDAADDIASIRRQAEKAVVFLARNEQGELERIILPVHGYGLWSTLYGFLALEADANTIVGLGFYDHAETPGLGGEVDNPAWKGYWKGKLVYGPGGQAGSDVAITVVKGAVDHSDPASASKIDGLAGATLTSRGVENLVRYWMGDNGFGPFLQKFKQQSASL